MRYFSTFTGVGGFEEGFKRAWPEAKCVGYSEIDKYACSVLRNKYPEVKNYGDITKLEQNINSKSKKEFYGKIYTIIEVSDNQRYKMMGNAVTVNVIAAIAVRIKDKLWD